MSHYPERAKVLIVEDEPAWAQLIAKEVRNQLRENLKIADVTVEQAGDGHEALRMVRAAGVAPFDLVVLDVVLGEGAAIDGLRVLAEIGIKSAAWMVAVFTGVENDPRTSRTLGTGKAKLIQQELRSRAWKSFPPERLMVIEKPAVRLDEKAAPGSEDLEKVKARLNQVVEVYGQLNGTRNVFRELVMDCEVPMVKLIDGTFVAEGSDLEKAAKKEGKLAMNGRRRENSVWFRSKVTHWQIRYDCGEMLTVPDIEGFRTLQTLLRRPGDTLTAGEILTAKTGETVEAPVGAQNFSDDESDTPGTVDCDDWRDYRASDEDDPFDGPDEESTRRSAAFEISGSQTEDWDHTEAESYRACAAALRKCKSRIRVLAAQSQRSKVEMKELAELKKQAQALAKEQKSLRRGGQSKVLDSVKQDLGRAVGQLRQFGLLALADHLRATVRSGRGKRTYLPAREMNWQT